MSAHLSEERISSWVAGDRTPVEEQHVRVCTECAAQAARLEDLLLAFRASVVEWSASQKGARPPHCWQPRQRTRSLTRAALRWSMAAAALAIAVAVPICRNAGDRLRETEKARADARLLDEIVIRVSQPVPAPLAPLMNLVAWEPAPDRK